VSARDLTGGAGKGRGLPGRSGGRGRPGSTGNREVSLDLVLGTALPLAMPSGGDFSIISVVKEPGDGNSLGLHLE
jgi:hypothetical protein